MTAAETAGRRRHVLVRHSVDGAGPVLGFVVGDQLAGILAGSVLAVLIALLVAGIRRHRGEPRRVVVGATVLVGVYALSAVLTGEGRGFFLPELLFNVVALVAFAVSLPMRRPLTAVGCSALRLEQPHCWTRPDRLRIHTWLTAGWVVMWALHVTLLVLLYRLDSVVGLGAASTVVNKPTLVAMLILTGVVARRRPAPVVDAEGV